MTTERSYTASELERYLVGELDDDRSAVIDRAAAEDGDLRAWIEERRAERQSFLLDPRRKNFATLVEEAKAAEKPSFLSRWIPTLSILAATTAVALFFVMPQESGIRNKGTAPKLSVSAAVLDGEGSKIFDGRSKLHPGDRLRLSIDDAKGGYVTVLLEEQSGSVEVLYQAKELGRLNPGTHRLPGSLQLDEQLGRERIYVLVSETPPPVDVWIDEIGKESRKNGFEHAWLPAGSTRVSTLEYEKVK